MTRKTLIQLHLIAAAFFTPVLLLIACSGGLYLLGYKGNVHSTPVSIPQGISIDINSTDLDATVRKLLQRLNQPSDFEYVKQKGATLFTRPTSKNALRNQNRRGVPAGANQSPRTCKKHSLNCTKVMAPYPSKPFKNSPRSLYFSSY